LLTHFASNDVVKYLPYYFLLVFLLASLIDVITYVRYVCHTTFIQLLSDCTDTLLYDDYLQVA